MKIVDYIVLTANSPAKITKKVREYIAKGYVPYDRLIAFDDEGYNETNNFIQAMVKYAN